MEAWRHAQFDALSPQWIVVMHAVESQSVEPYSGCCHVRMFLCDSGNRAPGQASHHYDLQAELFGHVLEFFDSLVGRMHGNDCGRGHTVREGAEVVRTEDVERPAGKLTQVSISNARDS